MRRRHVKIVAALGAAAAAIAGVITWKRKMGSVIVGDVGAIDRATGILLRAVETDTHEPPKWSNVTMGDLTLTVATDALKAPAGDSILRLPVSWPDTIAICRKLGCVPPSKKIADAIYAAAPIKTAFHSLVTANDPESGGVKMHGLPFAKRYNADVDKQIADAIAAEKGDEWSLVSGHEKYWLLSPRLAEAVKATGRPAAVNYGGWDASGKPQQSPGARHDVDYEGDYSQLLRPIQRYATRPDGSKVDLLDLIEEDGVSRRFTDIFR